MSRSPIMFNIISDFLDHVLRETPSKTLIAIKRSFFARTEERVRLGGGVEAMKGVYQSIRLAQVSFRKVQVSTCGHIIDLARAIDWSSTSTSPMAPSGPSRSSGLQCLP